MSKVILDSISLLFDKISRTSRDADAKQILSALSLFPFDFCCFITSKYERQK